MNTRTGKIARLPNAIREQLNQRLRDGVKADDILHWLNPLPEVKAILDAEFEGKPVSNQNITAWRSGGYRDWLNHQETLDLFSNIQGQDYSSLNNPPQGPTPASLIASKLVLWTLTQLASFARDIAATEDPEEKWKRLRELSADLSRLRRTEAYSEFIRLQSEWLALDQSKTQAAMEKLFEKWIQREEVRAKHIPNYSGRIVTPELWEQVERELNLL